uniref:hypothetical protein n=1 Tax=Actinomadura roseirufa TaxID=2094049 RepID=UPI001A955DBC
RALRRSGVTAADVGAVALGATGFRGLRAPEEDAVRDVLGGPPPHVLRTPAVLGETYSASGALQIAGLLAAWRHPGAVPAGAAPVALVTSLGDDGYCGCLVMRRA